MSFDDLFGQHRVMAILRGLPPDASLELAGRIWDAGIELLEVPIGAPEHVAALAAVANLGRQRGKAVGAGTVVSAEQVHTAAQAGARYTVAPGLDLAVVAASLAAGLPHLPGVATPTEVQAALRAGCVWVKAFPAVALGPAWFSAIRGPFPAVRLVATGGVDAESGAQFLAAGARIVAVGGALAKPDQLSRLADLAND
jgi:2-dehydro-3-deoxyphosphogluconate aldolase/(4S)-4-hydroxy-2-oxoglutarate aldolase